MYLANRDLPQSLFNLTFGSEDVFSLVIPIGPPHKRVIGAISCDRRLENVKSGAG